MATRLALAIGVAFPKLAMSGFEAGSDSRDGLLSLAPPHGAAPIPLKLLAIWLVWNFPLDQR